MINVLNDFLINRKQRVVLIGQCLPWVDIRAGVPRGFILGSLLFRIYINDLANEWPKKCKLFDNET